MNIFYICFKNISFQSKTSQTEGIYLKEDRDVLLKNGSISLETNPFKEFLSNDNSLLFVPTWGQTVCWEVDHTCAIILSFNTKSFEYKYYVLYYLTGELEQFSYAVPWWNEALKHPTMNKNHTIIALYGQYSGKSEQLETDYKHGVIVLIQGHQSIYWCYTRVRILSEMVCNYCIFNCNQNN